MREARLLGTWSSEGRALKAERRGSANALGQEHAECVGEVAGRPAWLQHRGRWREDCGGGQRTFWRLDPTGPVGHGNSADLIHFETRGPLEGSEQRKGMIRFESFFSF